MARIRTIKPEFWTNEQVADCSPIARLLFVGLWNFCDDHGNHPASLKTLKMEIFPGDDFTAGDIEGMVQELIRNDLIIKYEVETKRYWHVTGWNHQKIDKPNQKYPTPDQGVILRPVVERSSNDMRPVVERSPEDVDVDVDVEGKGRDVETPPTPSMTLFEIRTAFREQTGVEPGGGVNQILSEICQTYTREAITSALLATGTRTPKPTNPFMYFLRTLQGHAHDRASPDNFDPTKDYPEGSFFALLKAEYEEEQREHQLRSSSS